MKKVLNDVITPKFKVYALPAFEDNYLWLLQIDNKAIVVDPGDAEVVIQALQQHHLELNAILITHHHHDHIGGVEALYKKYACQIYAPFNSPLKQPYTAVGEQQPPSLSKLGLQCKILELPGHTLDHIAYLIKLENASQTHLFSGDVLFSAGCGRLFEGTYTQMWSSLLKIIQIPAQTLIYPAHEYTLKNLQFAKQLEPDNQALLKYEQQCLQLRENNQPTLPTDLQTELALNPFLRCSNIGDTDKALAKFKSLREQRNLF